MSKNVDLCSSKRGFRFFCQRPEIGACRGFCVLKAQRPRQLTGKGNDIREKSGFWTLRENAEHTLRLVRMVSSGNWP
jgi:hypothetical protein